MELINKILSLPAAALSKVTQGLFEAKSTDIDYVVQPAFKGLSTGIISAKDGINAVIVKPLEVAAQGVVAVAKIVDPYVSATAVLAGTGLLAKGIYDFNHLGVTDKSGAKKIIAGGGCCLTYCMIRFAITYFTEEAPKTFNDDYTPNHYLGLAPFVAAPIFITIACWNLRLAQKAAIFALKTK